MPPRVCGWGKRSSVLRNRMELVGRPRCLIVKSLRSRFDFRGNALLIARILIVVMALWLPMQSMAAVGMAFCHQMPQDDSSVGTPAADIPICDQAHPETLQSCKLCHACIHCVTPALGDTHLTSSFSPPSTLEPVATSRPRFRSLDVLEHPPRQVLLRL